MKVKEYSIDANNTKHGKKKSMTKTHDSKALLNVKEVCEYLGIGQTKARELLCDPRNGFTVRIGNRIYAHKGKLDNWLLNQILWKNSGTQNV